MGQRQAGNWLMSLLHYLDKQGVSISTDKLLGERDVGGDSGQQLQGVTAHAGVWTLNAFIQIFSVTALTNTLL